MACRTPGPTCGAQGTTVIDPGTRIPTASPQQGPTGKADATAEPKGKVLGSCELVLTRTTFTENSTMGELSHGGRHFCYTLEDVERDEKIYGKTAIPAKIYEVRLTRSPKFNRVLPELFGVKDFSGVRIHSGNSAADTEGCILVGYTQQPDLIGNSRKALKDLMALLEPYAAAKAGIRIAIKHGKAAGAKK